MRMGLGEDLAMLHVTSEIHGIEAALLFNALS